MDVIELELIRLWETYICGYHRKPSNLMIISRDITQDSAYEMAFCILKLLHYNLLLAQPSSSGVVLPTCKMALGVPTIIPRRPLWNMTKCTSQYPFLKTKLSTFFQ